MVLTIRVRSAACIALVAIGSLALVACEAPTPSSGPDSAQTPVDPPSTSASEARPAGSATGSATLTWKAPTRKKNGAELKNLAGFRIYYGQDPAALTVHLDVPGAQARTTTIGNLAKGTWYFAVAAYTTDGLESPMTSIVSKTVE